MPNRGVPVDRLAAGKKRARNFLGSESALAAAFCVRLFRVRLAACLKAKFNRSGETFYRSCL
ncbi:MAG: hypothetical protein K2X27_25580 [Candidatus Obscuribacterales bacterium]|nr:hypothetical protein [Candidatus Obscuribacterales bacterium]